MELTAPTHSLNNKFGQRSKDRQFKIQLELVYKAFKGKSMTIIDDRKTGVMRSEICFFFKFSDTVSPYVQELTTTSNLFPQSNQLKVFRLWKH